MRGGKHVKVKKRQHQDILRHRATTQKLILWSIGTLLVHLSVKFETTSRLQRAHFALWLALHLRITHNACKRRNEMFKVEAL